MKTVLVTGSTGFLGKSLVTHLLNNQNLHVIAVLGRHKEESIPFPEHPRMMFCYIDDFFVKSFPEIDTVVNCAFSRSSDSSQLAQSLDFTKDLIERLRELDVKSTINISSQGVYHRLPVGMLSNEDSPIAPIDLYSMAKYASEKMFVLSSLPCVTNVRLGSLLMPQRFLYFFVRKAMNGEPFTLTAPKQYAALLDVSDAVNGIDSIVSLDSTKRSEVYNLGIGTQYSLLQYAQTVKTIGDNLGYHVTFDVSDNGTETCAGMDNTRLKNDTGWEPRLFKDEMVVSLFNAMANN